tara:strand:- start:1024 stop:1362 length:339 start_codon:yes stop_codon:yes gene_type:complete
MFNNSLSPMAIASRPIEISRPIAIASITPFTGIAKADKKDVDACKKMKRNKMVQDSFERQSVGDDKKKREDTSMSLDFFVGSPKDYNKKLWSNFTKAMADSFKHRRSAKRLS